MYLFLIALAVRLSKNHFGRYPYDDQQMYQPNCPQTTKNRPTRKLDESLNNETTHPACNSSKQNLRALFIFKTLFQHLDDSEKE